MSTTGIDISYVVPVYNALPYLEKTAESLLGQKYDLGRVEFVFVDDGSTDGSGEYLDTLKGRAPHVTVLHMPNSGGPATPRNAGLEKASGEYVFFCDADDWMDKGATKRMVAHAREWGSDILVVKAKGENGRKLPPGAFRLTLPKADVYTTDVCQALGPCKLFRRAFLQEQGLKFEYRWPVWEDQPFVARAYMLAKTVSVAADAVYCHWYARDDGGATNVRDTVSFADVETYLFTMLDLFKEFDAEGGARYKFRPRVLREGLFYAGRALAREPLAEQAALFTALRERIVPVVDEWCYRMFPIQRCLALEALVAGDMKAWMDICLAAPEDEAFSADAFEYDDERKTATASWKASDLVYSADAQGRVPLDFQATGLRWTADSLLIRGTFSTHALYGVEKTALDLVKRGHGMRVHMPVHVGVAGAGKTLAELAIPLDELVAGSDAKVWDLSIVAEYKNGRVQRQRIVLPAGFKEQDVQHVLDAAHGYTNAQGSIAVLPYQTAGGNLGLMNCLRKVKVAVRVDGRVMRVELQGVPKAVAERVPTAKVVFTCGKKELVADVPVNGSAEVHIPRLQAKTWREGAVQAQAIVGSAKLPLPVARVD